jgi:hypothetical protein
MKLNVNHLRRGIQIGLIVLVALMPFHAFFSVWLGSLTGYQTIIQAWKEVLLLALGVLGALLVWRDPGTRRRLSGWPVRLIALFAIIALLVTAFARPPFTAMLFGVKTDLEFFVAFILAVLVATPRLVRTLVTVILASASVVVGFGLLQAYVLPAEFLTQFGYGPSTIPPYLKLDPAIDDLRFSSTLGGPNQLGTYLILPIVLAAVVALRRRQWWWLLLSVAGTVVLFHTHSRSAWIGAVVAVVVATILLVPRRHRLLAFLGIGAAATAAAAYVTQALGQGGKLQYFLLHSNVKWHDEGGSDFTHIESLNSGIAAIITNPLGHGLGSAGPAFFHTGQGRIIEDFYLQVGYETGLAGGLIFILIILATARELAARAARHDLALAAFAALAGISVVAIVLPSWADSSTALIFWTAAGSVIGLGREGKNV